MPEAASPLKYRLTFDFIAAAYVTAHEAAAVRIRAPVATTVMI
jgi:hypothetical protein